MLDKSSFYTSLLGAFIAANVVATVLYVALWIGVSLHVAPPDEAARYTTPEGLLPLLLNGGLFFGKVASRMLVNFAIIVIAADIGRWQSAFPFVVSGAGINVMRFALLRALNIHPPETEHVARFISENALFLALHAAVAGGMTMFVFWFFIRKHLPVPR